MCACVVVCTVQIIRLINPFFLSLPIFPQHTLFTPTIYTSRLVRHANTCLHSILLGLKLVQAGSYDEIDPVRQHTTTLVISTLDPPPPKKTGLPAPLPHLLSPLKLTAIQHPFFFSVSFPSFRSILAHAYRQRSTTITTHLPMPSMTMRFSMSRWQHSSTTGLSSCAPGCWVP